MLIENPHEAPNGNRGQTGCGDTAGVGSSSLAQTDALCKLLIEKGVITQAEFMQKLSVERAVYQAVVGKIR